MTLEIPSPPRITKAPAPIKLDEPPQTAPEKNTSDLPTKCVLKKPGGMIWGTNPHTQADLIALIKLGKITTEWDATDGISVWKVADLVSDVDAEFNPPPDAECYLFTQGEQSGPFSPAQICAMWRAGSVTSDALYFYSQLPDWRPAKSFCELRTDEARTSHNQSLDLGGIFAIIGVVIVIYFVAFYDVSVRTSSGDSVVNIGKQQNRLIGVIVGIALSSVGAVMIYFPTKSNET